MIVSASIGLKNGERGGIQTMEINELLKLCDDSRLEGAIQELGQFREKINKEFEIKPAVKFFNNSQFKQLCHMTSELWECWKAWLKLKFYDSDENEEELACELIDLQTSTQTMLEGPLNYTNWYIKKLRSKVVQKNRARNYHVKP